MTINVKLGLEHTANSLFDPCYGSKPTSSHFPFLPGLFRIETVVAFKVTRLGAPPFLAALLILVLCKMPSLHKFLVLWFSQEDFARFPPVITCFTGPPVTTGALPETLLNVGAG